MTRSILHSVCGTLCAVLVGSCSLVLVLVVLLIMFAFRSHSFRIVRHA